MVYGYMTGYEQPGDFSVSKDRRIGGYAVGIIRSDCTVPFLPGDVANACTFNFPVLYKVVKGLIPQNAFKNDPTVAQILIDAAKELEKDGVRAIAGTTCGFYGNYQRQVSAAVNIPVFLSSLVQIPLIQRAIKPDQKIGVITANEPALSPQLLESVGVIDSSNLVIKGAQDFPAFKSMILETGNYNSANIEEELLTLAEEMVNKHPQIAAFLLECAQLPTYAWSIQRKVQMPVWDFSTLINWVYSATVRRTFPGYV
jgi:hypothetical protein